MPPLTLAAQLISISTALLASGGIAALTLFDVLLLQSQPASRSLPSIRWLFSRGSHVFPQACVLSTLGFSYLVYTAVPTGSKVTLNLLRNARVGGYLGAAILCLAIAPWTDKVMIPANFKLIQMNEKMGGARSAESAKVSNDQGQDRGSGSAEDSVAGKGQASQFTDLSGPQEKNDGSSKADDAEVRRLLGEFGRLNMVRAGFMAAGGIVGLYTTLL